MNTVIIPQHNSLIAQWRNKKLEVVRKTGIPYHSSSVITDNGLIATVCFPSGGKQEQGENEILRQDFARPRRAIDGRIGTSS